MLFDKKIGGVFWSIILCVIFTIISIWASNVLSGVPWFLFSSLLRLIFGIIILFIAKTIYGRTAKEIMSFNGSKAALTAGAGFILYFVYYLIILAFGVKTITGLSAGLFFSQVILQQITTGFFEEINYRYLICEGYFYTKRVIKNKLIYAFISFVIFGAAHIITEWSIYTFLLTGSIGFAFAVMYIKSGNILVPMLLHFTYDVFANISYYIEMNNSSLFMSMTSVFEIVLAAMFVISIIMLIRKDKYEVQKELNL